MKPKSKAKQTKWNLVSPMSCYDKFIFTFIITNFSVMRSDNLVGIGDKRSEWLYVMYDIEVQTLPYIER